MDYIFIKNNGELLKIVLENGHLFDIGSKTIYNASTSDPRLLKMLLEYMSIRYGCAIRNLVNVKYNKDTSLYKAAIEDRIENMKLLLDYGAAESINERYGNNGETLFHLSITCLKCNTDIEKIELLIRYGADINAQDISYQYTPLHLAIEKRRDDIVSFLLEKGADIKIMDQRGRNALHHAAVHKNIYGMQTLIEHARDLYPNYINEKDDWSKSTPLHIICTDFDPYPDIVKLLIDNGANLDEKDTYGETPIFRAVNAGNIDHTQILIKHGADIDAQDNVGNTPLHTVGRWNIEMIKVLLMGGANYTILNKNGVRGMKNFPESIREEMIEKYSSLTLELKEPDE